MKTNDHVVCDYAEVGCRDCVAWVRRTQFAGDHYFCAKHAEEQKDFGKEDPSYFYWKKLDIQGVQKQVRVQGERNKAVPAVYLLLERILEGNHKILLMRRCNTGYQDGNYNLPSGHVEDGELPIDAMIREANEELGIDVVRADLRFMHASYRPKHDETGNRVDFFFHASKWSGEVINGEPDKCDDLLWVHPNELPSNMTPHVRQIIGYMVLGIVYSELGINFLKREGVYLLDV